LRETDIFISDATITKSLPPPQRGPVQATDTSACTTIQQVVNGSSEKNLKWIDCVIFQVEILSEMAGKNLPG